MVGLVGLSPHFREGVCISVVIVFLSSWLGLDWPPILNESLGGISGFLRMLRVFASPGIWKSSLNSCKNGKVSEKPSQHYLLNLLMS